MKTNLNLTTSQQQTNVWKQGVVILDSWLHERNTRIISGTTSALGWSWATSTLSTHKGRLSRLHAFASSMPTSCPPRLVVEEFLLQSLASGCSASTIRSTLSAVNVLHTVGLISQRFPKQLWRLSISAERLHDTSEIHREWFPLEALELMAKKMHLHRGLQGICHLHFGAFTRPPHW